MYSLCDVVRCFNIDYDCINYYFDRYSPYSSINSDYYYYYYNNYLLKNFIFNGFRNLKFQIHSILATSHESFLINFISFNQFH